MSLVNEFVQLNAMAVEVEDAISEIQIDYLEGNDEYPYGDVNDLVSKYDLMLEKLYKRKNSVINEFLNNFSTKRKASFEGLKAPDKYEVLALGSEKTIPYILNIFEQYIPVDKQSEQKISDKLFPIVKDLELGSITSLYRKFKKRATNMDGIDLDTTLAYLQQSFVGYIIAKLSHNPMNKFSSSRFMWTYDEVCKTLLEEPILKVPEKNNNKSR